MITVPVSASMYQSMMANIQQIHTNSDGTVCITPMQVDATNNNNNNQNNNNNNNSLNINNNNNNSATNHSHSLSSKRSRSSNSSNSHTSSQTQTQTNNEDADNIAEQLDTDDAVSVHSSRSSSTVSAAALPQQFQCYSIIGAAAAPFMANGAASTNNAAGPRIIATLGNTSETQQLLSNLNIGNAANNIRCQIINASAALQQQLAAGNQSSQTAATNAANVVNLPQQLQLPAHVIQNQQSLVNALQTATAKVFIAAAGNQQHSNQLNLAALQAANIFNGNSGSSNNNNNSDLINNNNVKLSGGMPLPILINTGSSNAVSLNQQQFPFKTHSSPQGRIKSGHKRRKQTAKVQPLKLENESEASNNSSNNATSATSSTVAADNLLNIQIVNALAEQQNTAGSNNALSNAVAAQLLQDSSNNTITIGSVRLGNRVLSVDVTPTKTIKIESID